MSVAVYQFIVPASPHLTFRPSFDQLGAIVRLLADTWIDSQATMDLQDLDQQNQYASAAAEELAQAVTSCLAERGSVFVQCPGPRPPTGLSDADLARQYSLDGSQDLVISGKLCYEVRILVANHLCTVPPDMSGTEILCLACGRDIMWEPEDEPSRAMMPYFPAPMQCPHCRAPLDHASLVGRTKVGNRLIEDVAPFYQFALMLLPAGSQQVEGEITTDPALLEDLGRVCGVAFRSVNRWG